MNVTTRHAKNPLLRLGPLFLNGSQEVASPYNVFEPWDFEGLRISQIYIENCATTSQGGLPVTKPTASCGTEILSHQALSQRVPALVPGNLSIEHGQIVVVIILPARRTRLIQVGLSPSQISHEDFLYVLQSTFSITTPTPRPSLRHTHRSRALIHDALAILLGAAPNHPRPPRSARSAVLAASQCRAEAWTWIHGSPKSSPARRVRSQHLSCWSWRKHPGCFWTLKRFAAALVHCTLNDDPLPFGIS